MKSYLLIGQEDKKIDATLEARLEAADITTGYRAKYLPVIELVTDKELEEITTLFPDYLVTENKLYEVKNDP